MLEACGVEFEVNPRLVRGLDYYTHTVFEWITTELGAQGTICGGGRYDGLVAQIGGPPTPGTGFSIGVERLVELLEARGRHRNAPVPDVHVLAVGEGPERASLALAEEIRNLLPGAVVTLDPAPGSFRAKLRRADRSGAALAIVLGEDELAGDIVQLKPLRGQGAQVACPRARLGEALRGWVRRGEERAAPRESPHSAPGSTHARAPGGVLTDREQH